MLATLPSNPPTPWRCFSSPVVCLLWVSPSDLGKPSHPLTASHGTSPILLLLFSHNPRAGKSGGCLRGQRFRPSTPEGSSPGPSGRREMGALFPSDLPFSCRAVPILAESPAVSGPPWVWEPLPSPTAHRDPWSHPSSRPPPLPCPTWWCGGTSRPLRCLRAPPCTCKCPGYEEMGTAQPLILPSWLCPPLETLF